jgi:hypothetical protein
MLYRIADAVFGEQLDDVKRPRLGIAVATVLGLINLIWFGDLLFSHTTPVPGDIQPVLYLAFPGYYEASLLRASLNLIGNSALLVGAFISAFYDLRGRAVVRAISWIMIAVAVVGTALMIGTLMGRSVTWGAMDTNTRNAVIGGLIVGAIGGLLQWSVLLFLFRNRIPKKQPAVS